MNTVAINVEDGTNRNATRIGAIHAIEAELEDLSEAWRAAALAKDFTDVEGDLPRKR